MSRRKNARTSVSPVRSVHSDESDNSNINDELPPVVLPKAKTKDGKGQKKVTFDFPVNVITKNGKFSGMGSIDLIDEALEKTLKLQKTKAELKDVISKFEHDLGSLMEREEMDELIHPVKVPKKGKAMVEKLAKAQAMKEALETKRKEMEVKRDAIKKAIEEERQAKAEREQAKKIYKPTECLKHLTLEMHPVLMSEWYMGPTLASAREVGVRVVARDRVPDPGLLTWQLQVPTKLVAHAGEVRLGPHSQSPCSVLVMTLELMTSFTTYDSLFRHVTQTSQLVPGCRALVLLTVYKGSLGMTREQVGKLICDLQIDLLLSCNLDVHCAESAEEVHDIILHYTKAVAEEPYKRAKRDIDEQAKFYMRGDNKNCVLVDKQGNGLSRLWEQMLSVLPQSSLEVARTLGADCTAPTALAQVLQSPGGVAKVADIGVSRTLVPGAKTRRLGPEFARKLHTLFTTEDGDTVIE